MKQSLGNESQLLAVLEHLTGAQEFCLTLLYRYVLCMHLYVTAVFTLYCYMDENKKTGDCRIMFGNFILFQISHE